MPYNKSTISMILQWQTERMGPHPAHSLTCPDTCLHNESRTKHQTITIPLYSHQWQTLLINRSCWARRETPALIAESRMPFSVDESWGRTVEIYSSSLESMILFRFKHVSDDSWGKKNQVNFIPLRDKKITGKTKHPRYSLEFGGKVLEWHPLDNMQRWFHF